MPGITRLVQGGAYSGPRSEPGGQNTPRAGRFAGALGAYGGLNGQFAQQVNQGDIFDDVADVASIVIASGIGVEDYAHTEASSGTITASGNIVEDYSYTEASSGIITASGTGIERNFTLTDYDKVIDADNPVSHWKLGDSTVTAFDRKGTYDLPAVNGPIATTTGLIAKNAGGLANTFVATSGQMFGVAAISDGRGLPYESNTFTIEAWIKPATPQSALVCNRNSAGRLSLLSNGNLRLDASIGGVNITVDSPNGLIVADNRYHIVGVYDGAAMVIYINGVEVGRKAATGVVLPQPEYVPVIGSQNGGGSEFDGVIDEVAWYNTALSAVRVAAHTQAGQDDAGSGIITVSGRGYEISSIYEEVLDQDAPTSHWRLGTDMVAYDRRRTLDLPAVSGPISPVSALVAGSDFGSTFGGTQRFGLANATNRGLPYETANWAVEAWIKLTTLATTQYAIYRANFILQTAGSVLRADVQDAASVTKLVSLKSPAVVGVTYHVVITYDGTDLIGYLDGVEVSRTPMTGTASAPNEAPTIGSRADGVVPFTGTVDDISWYSTALSAVRVLAHFQAGNPGTFYNDSRSGIGTLSGSGIESYSSDDNRTGTSTISGSGVESYVYADNLTGTVAVSGSRTESFVSTDSRTVTVSVIGTGFETNTPYDAVLDEDNPVSHWKLGDPNTAIDRRQTRNLPSIGGPIGTAAGLVANNASHQANEFTGVANVSFDAGSGGTLGVPYQGAFTMEAWIKPTVDASGVILKRTTATQLSLITTGDGTNVQVEFRFENSANASFFLLAPYSPYRLTINQTYHVVGTYDGTTAILYINGIEAIRTTSVGVGGIRSSLTTPPFIGSGVAGSWPRAVVDEVAWYNTALTSARILAHYQAGVATAYDAVIDADTPVSHWKMGWSTTKAVDRARRQLDLKAQNPPIAISDKGVVYQGDNDRANTFVTGLSQRISHPNSGNADADARLYNTANFSVEAWIKPTAAALVAASSFGILQRSGPQVGLYLLSAKPRFEFNDPSISTKVTTSPTAVVASAAYHLVGTYDGATEILYVNGIEVARLATATGVRSDPTLYPRIGYVGADYWDGDIDEVAWYDTALSPARVRAHYLAGLAGYITVSGTGIETSYYTDNLTGTVTVSGTGIETYDYTDNLTGTVAVSGTGTENYSSSGPTYTDAISGTITAQGTSTETYIVTDNVSGLINVSGTSTETYAHTVSLTGTGTVSGSGVESYIFDDSRVGTGTISGSGVESYSYNDSLSGTGTISGSGVESYVYTDSRSGTGVISGSGVESSSILVTYDDAASGTIAVQGAAIENYVFADSTMGMVVASGTGSDAFSTSDTGIGTIEVTGTGTDTDSYAEVGIGTAVISGTGTESASHTASSTGTAVSTGISSETAVHSESSSGTFVLSGTGIDNKVYDDALSGTTLISGTGVESSEVLVGYADAGSGQVNAIGTSVESQSHTNIAVGSLLANGTGVESQSHTSTATGSLSVTGTGSETYVLDSGVSYTDISEGTVTSTGTGVESVSYSNSATGTVTSIGISVDTVYYSNTAIGSVTLIGSGVESRSYKDASTGTIVLRAVDSHAKPTQPVPVSTVIALNRAKVRVWNKAPIQSMITSTTPIMVHIALKHNVKVNVAKLNQMKVLTTNR